MAKAEQIHRAFANEMRLAEALEKAGYFTEAAAKRGRAERKYTAERRGANLGVVSRHRAECRHADAAGDPLVRGGQGRSGSRVEAATICAGVFVALALAGFAYLWIRSMIGG